MKALTRLHGAIGFALAGYFILAVIICLAIHPGNEIFPLYAWNLFCRVPNVEREHLLYLRKVGDQELPEPLFYRDAGAFVSAANTIELHRLVQDWGEALLFAPERAPGLRHALETTYLARAPQPVVYELRQVRVKPLRYVRTGAIEKTENVRVFTSGQP